MAYSQALVHWSQYLAARVLAMGMTMFNAEGNLQSAAALGRMMYRMDRRHRDRATLHLTQSFPELSPSQIQDLVRGSFEHFMQLVVEVCHTPRLIHSDSWSQRVSLTDMGPAIRLLNAGKPMIMVTGHLGNWEVLGYLLAVLGYPMHAIARPIDNPYINRWLLGIRERRGMEIITKWDATERMMQVIADGGALGFIADQNAGERGMFVPFFGRLASTYKSIGLLAMRKHLPIVCGYGHRVGHQCVYRMGIQDVILPEHWAGRDDPLFYITARYMHAIEMMIRACPEQYFWMHRRWKSRPRWEKEGKPMPDSVRRNLESLPWIDQATMTRLLEPVTIAY